MKMEKKVLVPFQQAIKELLLCFAIKFIFDVQKVKFNSSRQ
jgi:hypothetical protein